MRIARSDITGLLLAGGMGSRMGGVDKGLLDLAGQVMAARVLARLRPQVGAVMINANRSLEHWRAFGDPVFGDLIGGYSGPLAGVHAGLDRCATEWMLTVPCDSPFFPDDLAARLMQAVASASADLAVARCEGHLQPVFALMRREVLPSLEKFLAAGERKIDRWFATLAMVAVDFPDAAAFANINTPAELAAVNASQVASR